MRKGIICRHNPVLTALSTDSPLSVGNGEFCFTADITGLQTLYDAYNRENFPLCTMSNWGWHTTPTNDGKVYEWEDLELTEYEHAGRKVYYPVVAKPGNEEVYHWLRHNPHKFNLCRVSLCRANGEEIRPEDIAESRQELDLYEGVLHSRFVLDGEYVAVTTVCDPNSDAIAFKIEGSHAGLGVRVSFPYGDHDTGGSCWDSADRHVTEWTVSEQGNLIAYRLMDDVKYYVSCDFSDSTVKADGHTCQFVSKGTDICGVLRFSPQIGKDCVADFDAVLENSRLAWAEYWNTVRIMDFRKTPDPRAMEIERRMVLSLYLFKIQSMGSLPSAETGLTVNSWYGRFHSEMYLWHSAFLPLWGLGEKLLPSLMWHYSIAAHGRELAKLNGYAGIRWPKQTANTGRDAPSIIAPLLVWQQPHIIYMLELLYQNTYKTQDFLKQHWWMVQELAEFMASFLYKNDTGQYEMLPPIIPAQEVFDPTTVKSPIFEMEYFRFGLGLACQWGNRLGECTQKWQEIADNIAPPVVKDGLYLAHALCPDTYTKYNRDHPMMTGIYGLFKSPMVQPNIMKATLDKVLECWEQETMWGWDYAMMAMCAISLGDSDLAVELLLSDSPKNQYVASGNNYQRTRTDLPLYLPGNGSLLLALPMLLAAPPKGWEIHVVK